MGTGSGEGEHSGKREDTAEHARIVTLSMPVCRGLIALAVAATLGLAAPGAAPAHSGHFTTVDVGGFAFAPAEVRVFTNDVVLWSWTGPDYNHSVTADPGQAESFDSDPGRTPSSTPRSEGFTHVFNAAGRYTYACKVHASMKGVVVVEPTPASDVIAPTIDNLTAPKRADRSVKLRFVISERATISLAIERLRPGRGAQLVRTKDYEVVGGPGSLAVATHTLRAGTYRFSMVGLDRSGNSGREVKVNIRII